RRARTRRRRAGWRQRQETENVAQRLPRRRQRERLPWRLPALGGRPEPATIAPQKGTAQNPQEIFSNARGGETRTPRIDAMKSTIKPLTHRPAWKALAAHQKKITALHLRQLFAAD